MVAARRAAGPAAGSVARGRGQGRARLRAVVITALPLEFRAVCDRIVGATERLNKGSVYQLGRLGGASGSGLELLVANAGPGNAGAAAEVERAIAFHRPRYAFFVGVAGGLKDVRVGDVVVGSKVYYYESGKDGEVFEPRPEAQPPGHGLAQRAQKEIADGLWVQRIRGGKPSAFPRAFFGPIAAGGKVVASTRSATCRRLKAAYPDALAVEMEGYGFLRACAINKGVEALVIRGISDLIDGKAAEDSSGSQDRAARAAAAFMASLACHLSGPGSPRSGGRGFAPDPEVEGLIKGIGVGCWDEAARAALEVVARTDRSTGRNGVFAALLRYLDLPEDDERFWGASHTIECCARLEPGLATRRVLSRMAGHHSFSVRSTAASICMDLAHSAPDLVPVDILLGLSVYDEDWYVEVPANAALKAMVARFPAVLDVFFARLGSAAAGAREHAAAQILDLARNEPELLDPERLVKEAARLGGSGDRRAAALLSQAVGRARRAKRATRYRYGF
jgi:nucleoside phosphorylase